MGQTRVKAGHIELVQGSKYTKNVKRMRWICARDKRRSNRSKSIFSLWVIRVSFFEVPLSCFESKKQDSNKMEFPARPLDKLEPLHASLKAFLSSIT